MASVRTGLPIALAGVAGILVGTLLTGSTPERPTLEAPVASTPTPSPRPAAAVSLPSWSEVAEHVIPGVVNVSSERVVRREPSDFDSPFRGPMEEFFREFFRFRGLPEEGRQQSLGSGFIVDKDGYILTNNHVVQSRDAKIIVKLSDESEYKAQVVGVDPETDLALLKIEAREPLTPLELGDSDKLRVGDWVMAVGNPLGFDRTVTVGVVSALGRSNLRFGTEGPAYQDYIQTDASINFGNSGGPLVDVHGRVVGVNSAITSPSGGNIGIGFAIPINLAHEVIDQLKEQGRVVRGWLGVQIGPLSKDLAEGLNLEGVQGVLINDVFEDSPAQKAGVKPGDVVLAIDGQKVSSAKELQFIVARRRVGSTVKLTINRDGKTMHLDVKLGERPSSIASAAPSRAEEDWLGMRVVSANSREAEELGVDTDEGVVIVELRRGGPAERAGLRVGDVIVKVGRTSVNTPSEFKRLTDAAKEAGKPVVFLVKNASGSRFVPIKPD